MHISGQGCTYIRMLGFVSYEKGLAQISGGDILLFYTDGITEASQDGRHFAERHILELIQSHIQRYTVAEFNGNAAQSDDRTVILLKRSTR